MNDLVVLTHTSDINGDGYSDKRIFLISLNNSKPFWVEVIKWHDIREVKIGLHSEKDIMFDIPKCADELFINLVLLPEKQYILAGKTDCCNHLKYFMPKLR